jgi:hypothetical protein
VKKFFISLFFNSYFYFFRGYKKQISQKKHNKSLDRGEIKPDLNKTNQQIFVIKMTIKQRTQSLAKPKLAV